jgi:hypothetical protein
VMLLIRCNDDACGDGVIDFGGGLGRLVELNETHIEIFVIRVGWACLVFV